MSEINHQRFRARELGISIGLLEPGAFNAITDVPGVKVGQVTLINGQGTLISGKGPVRTGVTVILPHEGNIYTEKVITAVHAVNGHGKATGFEQIREMGVLETPIALTNTLNVGLVWDALTSWTLEHDNLPKGQLHSINPVVGECNDSILNDIAGRHVKPEHVWQALEQAKSGLVDEGAVGAGTGMVCFEFKGGVGTASRRVGDYHLGVLVVANFGERELLSLAGVPIGRHLKHVPLPSQHVQGSIMMVVATDAPMSARQLGRIARRTGHGLARCGSIAGNSSGDFAIAFSTAQRISALCSEKVLEIKCMRDAELNPFFQAVTESTEEAVINALLKANTMQGRDDMLVNELPIPKVVELMHQYGHTQVSLPQVIERS